MAIGYGGKIGTEQTRASGREESDVEVGRQGSADSRLKRFPERSGLGGRQLHDEPPTTL